mmetsp:Transcript_83941/g.203586  ORF Transcript_83941/g.203586 Transcript_83941/m.203586 type:complete len:400 (+) Transcript_83941:201-1400(+)
MAAAGEEGRAAGSGGAGGHASEAADAPATKFSRPTFATPEERDEFIDRVKGLLYGNCIGDAVGLSTEFMNKDEAAMHYGTKVRDGTYEYADMRMDMHRHRWAKGDWTDDSDQMLLLLRSMVQHDGEIVPSDFGAKLKYWMRNGFPELGDSAGCGVGYTVMSVLTHRLFSKDPNAASMEVWERSGRALAANGAVMRTSIMAVPHFDDLDRMIDDTVKMARVTHSDPRSVSSCVAATTALALMLQGKHKTADGDFDTEALTAASLEQANKHLPTGCDAPADSAFGYHVEEAKRELARHCTVTDVTELRLDEPKAIGYTLKCVGSGFWALRTTRDFRLAMGELIAEAGDADTNGAVAGAMLGCRLGFKKLHAQAGSWVDKIPAKQRKFLDTHVKAILDAMLT